MKRVLFAIGCALLPLIMSGQEISLDSNNIVIGSRTRLSVKGATTYPTLDELQQDGIVALRQWMDTAGKTQYSELTSFDAGEHWLHIGNDSILLTVRDVPDVDTTTDSIRDIAGMMKEPLTFWDVARWVLLALGIVAVLAAIIYVARRIHRKQPILSSSSAPLPPLEERSLAALEALRQKKLWQQGRIKEYYTELTDIVRRHIEEACGIASTEMTTEQTLEAFAQRPMPRNEEDDRLLGEVLRTADMVKFAKSEPLPHVHDNALTQAIELVRDIKKKEDLSDDISKEK